MAKTDLVTGVVYMIKSETAGLSEQERSRTGGTCFRRRSLAQPLPSLLDRHEDAQLGTKLGTGFEVGLLDPGDAVVDLSSHHHRAVCGAEARGTLDEQEAAFTAVVKRGSLPGIWCRGVERSRTDRAGVQRRLFAQPLAGILDRKEDPGLHLQIGVDIDIGLLHPRHSEIDLRSHHDG